VLRFGQRLAERVPQAWAQLVVILTQPNLLSGQLEIGPQRGGIKIREAWTVGNLFADTGRYVPYSLSSGSSRTSVPWGWAFVQSRALADQGIRSAGS
jgi:hypothetical protein